MNGQGARQLEYVGVGLVAINFVTALGVMWVVGNRVARELADAGMFSALPAATQLAFDVRPGATLFVLVGLLLAVIVHRAHRPVPIFVVIAALQLALSVAYGLALWLPYPTFYGGIIK